MASLRCAAPLSEIFSTCQVLNHNCKGYGVSGHAPTHVNGHISSKAGPSREIRLKSGVRRGMQRGRSERSEEGRPLCVASVEAPEVAIETIGSELWEQRRAIQEEEEKNRTFRIQEVDTVEHQDWHSAKVIDVQDVATGIRCITVETEVSREMVALDKAYTKPGQMAQVKVGGKEVKIAVSSPPFSAVINAPVLYKLRGDIPAGTTKLPQFSLSVNASLDLHVEEATSAVFNLAEGEELEVGPFEATDLDLRPVIFLARFPTLTLFAQGAGIAVARSILENKDGDMGSLNLSFREDVRLYYSARKPSLLAYKQKFTEWEAKKVKVRATVDDKSGEDWEGYVGSFSSLWDEDDIEYDPETTAAVVCVEKAARKEVMDLLAEAGIPENQIVAWDI